MRSFLQLTYSRLQVNWSKLFSYAVEEEGEGNGPMASCKSQLKGQGWQKASADQSQPTLITLGPLSTSTCLKHQIIGFLPFSLTCSFLHQILKTRPSKSFLCCACLILRADELLEVGTLSSTPFTFLHLCPQNLEQCSLYIGAYGLKTHQSVMRNGFPKKQLVQLTEHLA